MLFITLVSNLLTGQQTYGIEEWTSVRELKARVAQTEGFAVENLRLFLNGKELVNTWHLSEVEDGAVIFLSSKASSNIANRGVSIDVYGDMKPSNRFARCLNQVSQGLSMGLKPLLTVEGTGGTYLLRDGRHRRPVAVFKPMDEEPGGVNNPRGLQGFGSETGLRGGVKVGEAQQREVAASLLDHHGFCGVSETVLAELCHPALCYRHTEPRPKLGSLQLFAPHDEVASDVSSSLFPDAQVHKIAILDIRLMNTDRFGCGGSGFTQWGVRSYFKMWGGEEEGGMGVMEYSCLPLANSSAPSPCPR